MNNIHTKIKQYIQGSLTEKLLQYSACLLLLSLLLFTCFLFYPIIKEIQLYINTAVGEINNAARVVYH